jgi:hypothetical protein
VQILWTGFLVGIFIYKVHGHNTSHCEPDAVNTLYSALRPPSALDDISYLDRHGLAEQQAVLLQYQQDNLQHFRKEILHLQESLSKYERMQDGSTPQVQTCDPAMVSFNQASAQVWHRLGNSIEDNVVGGFTITCANL